MIVINTLGSDL